MSDLTELRLYNTLTRREEAFSPIDSDNVRMYVCGPTVYDFAHIGNARPAIVFDVLYRLLRHLYGTGHVKYVRNITDVDDKINARALRDHPGMELNEAIRLVTEKTEAQYHADVRALGCLEPDEEPRATENISQMIDIIQKLLDRGHAYIAEGGEGQEVLFSTASMPDYGQLSKRRLEDQQAGARVAVEAHKKNPADFVLWKESASDQPGWIAEFSVAGETRQIYGRPGWHIECSAMSGRYLGEVFDIHGGGLDLIFPHHENEIAQSRCAHGTHAMAKYWLHNGFLQVEGRKMSKSEGNFVTIHELLATKKFGGRRWSGRVLKYAMLMTHYRDPIDFKVSNLEIAAEKLSEYATILDPNMVPDLKMNRHLWDDEIEPSERLIDALKSDLNTPSALQVIDTVAKAAARGSEPDKVLLAHNLRFLGLLEKRLVRPHQKNIGALWNGAADHATMQQASALAWELKIALANDATSEIESLKNDLQALGFSVTTDEYGAMTVDFHGKADNWIEDGVEKRKTILDAATALPKGDPEKARLFAEADAIRDALAKKGVQLKDGKDPATGARITTWELK